MAAQQSENFAGQNSRQESRNPWMDFWFHVFGNAERKKSEFYKKYFGKMLFLGRNYWIEYETKKIPLIAKLFAVSGISCYYVFIS